MQGPQPVFTVRVIPHLILKSPRISAISALVYKLVSIEKSRDAAVLTRPAYLVLDARPGEAATGRDAPDRFDLLVECILSE